MQWKYVFLFKMHFYKICCSIREDLKLDSIAVSQTSRSQGDDKAIYHKLAQTKIKNDYCDDFYGIIFCFCYLP